MSNSSRIEVATRKSVGQELTNKQIEELVKIADPTWKGGVYPSDVAYNRTPDGLQPRGKTAYGDGVLEYLGENRFKVLATDQIVRMPRSAKKAAVAATPVPAPAPAKAEKKAAKAASKPPIPTKRATADRHAAQ